MILDFELSLEINCTEAMKALNSYKDASEKKGFKTVRMVPYGLPQFD